MAINIQSLSGYRRCTCRIQGAWPGFLDLRLSMLSVQDRYGKAAEKVAENIVGALFTQVLDWEERDLNWQLDRADLVLSHNFAKYLVVETKRPGALSSRTALESALSQASRYAHEQCVSQIAVCDGNHFFAADIVEGGWVPRLSFNLAQEQAPIDALWWISMDGIHRPCENHASVDWGMDADPEKENHQPDDADTLLHPKYQIPSRCFAYVGHPEKTSTWKLPYLLHDGTTDMRRLPKAIQSLASNYRGAKVRGIPDQAIPHVFRRLAEAAKREGKMPAPGMATAPVYQILDEILKQLDSSGV